MNPDTAPEGAETSAHPDKCNHAFTDSNGIGTQKANTGGTFYQCVKCYEWVKDAPAPEWRELCRRREALADATNLIADIMWDKVNAIDECEKWLRAYAPDRLSAPEEPVSEGTRIAAEARSACNDLTEEERKRYASLAEDVLKLHRPDEGSVWAKHGLSEPTEPAPEWRELGPDEVICEGDEEEYTDAWGEKMWLKVVDCKRAGTNTRLRTRRPLPKQEEMPLEDEIEALWEQPKQEEMPLEDEIETLWEHSDHIDSLTGHMAFKALAKSISYLRDEIHKLKYMQDQHRKSLDLFCNQLVDLKQK